MNSQKFFGLAAIVAALGLLACDDSSTSADDASAPFEIAPSEIGCNVTYGNDYVSLVNVTEISKISQVTTFKGEYAVETTTYRFAESAPQSAVDKACANEKENASSQDKVTCYSRKVEVVKTLWRGSNSKMIVSAYLNSVGSSYEAKCERIKQ